MIKNQNRSKNTLKKRPKKAPIENISKFDQKVAVSYLTQIVVAQLSSALIEVSKEKGWRQADLARRLEIDEAQVSRWLKGRQPNMTLETIALLAAAMEREPEFELKAIERLDEKGAHHTIRLGILPDPLEWNSEPVEADEWESTVNSGDIAHA